MSGGKSVEQWRQELIARFRTDRWLAHTTLFPHRHVHASPPFHREVVKDFWLRRRYGLELIFRGAAKSTLAEEDIVLAVAERAFKNILIIGASETRAVERLEAVKYELEMNDLVNGLYGEQGGEPWTQTKIVTSAGICVQAMGRGQDLRGVKHLDDRPDLIVVDDFEDRDLAETPAGRAKTMRWFFGELLPACNPAHKIRVLATPLDPESAPMQLIAAGWPHRIVPIVYLDENGEEQSAWPERFPLAWIREQRALYEKTGQARTWSNEFLCQPVSERERIFQGPYKVEPRTRTWEATYAMLDPARTVRQTSATTGCAVWSWLHNRLVVWESWAKLLLPDEIIAACFQLHEQFDPVWIGIEEDGLEEFIRQPLRQAQLGRGVYLPVRGARAPRGKLDFIRGLQPFFAAGEVSFSKPLPDLAAQLEGFPTGRIDAPNALAYALLMRPGAPIYDVGTEHIAAEIEPILREPAWLALGADGRVVTAALVQVQDGRLCVIADWVREGRPGEVLERIVQAAGMEAPTLRGTAAPHPHFDPYQNFGLEQAARTLQLTMRKGAEPQKGRDVFRRQLERQIRGIPAIRVSTRARWTLNALMGGYARGLSKQGVIMPDAEPGPYRTLIEGIEAFAGMLQVAVAENEEMPENVAYDRFGRAYRSAMPQTVRR